MLGHSMEKGKKKNIILPYFTKYIRLADAMKWSAISFFGFLIGIQSLSLYEYFLPGIVFLITTICIMAFALSINNYFDADSDRKNPRRMQSNPIASGEISEKTGIFIIIFLCVVPLIVSFFYKREVFFFSILLLVWMEVYSAPPFRMKGKPGVDVIWHFFGFFFFILWGSLIAGSLTQVTWFIAVSIGMFSSIGQVWNHIVDYSFDKESGTKTYAVKVGVPSAKKTLNVLIGIHVVLLLPLFWFYSLRYVVTLLIFIVLLLIGFLLVHPKKDGFPSKHSYEFYFATILGGAVYVSYLVYYIFSIVGIHLMKIF